MIKDWHKKQLIFILAILLGGCSSISYKGVTVYIEQHSGGSSYADSAKVPDHQQGSDVLVPALEIVTDIYEIETDAWLDALKECRKAMKLNPGISCGDIQTPDRPQIPTEPDQPKPEPGEPPIEPDQPDQPLPEVNASWGGGNLWKPVADSRGGVPVVLTAPQYPQGRVTLYGELGVIETQVEYRGPTNGSRQTYYLMNHSAGDLPENLRVQVGELVFLVPDATQRYD